MSGAREWHEKGSELSCVDARTLESASYDSQCSRRINAAGRSLVEETSRCSATISCLPMSGSKSRSYHWWPLTPRSRPARVTTAGRRSCVAFPDDGAAKRFAYMFEGLGYHTVICGKVKRGQGLVSISGRQALVGQGPFARDRAAASSSPLFASRGRAVQARARHPYSIRASVARGRTGRGVDAGRSYTGCSSRCLSCWRERRRKPRG